jgi:hypothetical protein
VSSSTPIRCPIPNPLPSGALTSKSMMGGSVAERACGLSQSACGRGRKLTRLSSPHFRVFSLLSPSPLRLPLAEACRREQCCGVWEWGTRRQSVAYPCCHRGAARSIQTPLCGATRVLSYYVEAVPGTDGDSLRECLDWFLEIVYKDSFLKKLLCVFRDQFLKTINYLFHP